RRGRRRSGGDAARGQRAATLRRRAVRDRTRGRARDRAVALTRRRSAELRRLAHAPNRGPRGDGIVPLRQSRPAVDRVHARGARRERDGDESHDVRVRESLTCDELALAETGLELVEENSGPTPAALRERRYLLPGHRPGQRTAFERFVAV